MGDTQDKTYFNQFQEEFLKRLLFVGNASIIEVKKRLEKAKILFYTLDYEYSRKKVSNK